MPAATGACAHPGPTPRDRDRHVGRVLADGRVPRRHAGKLMLGLRITHEDGATTPPGLGKALLRAFPASSPHCRHRPGHRDPRSDRALIMVINDHRSAEVYDRIAGTRSYGRPRSPTDDSIAGASASSECGPAHQRRARSCESGRCGSDLHTLVVGDRLECLLKREDLGGVRRMVSSDDCVRMLVLAFSRQMLTSMSSLREFSPTTMPS